MVGLIYNLINHRMKMHNVDEQVNSDDEEVFILRSSISFVASCFGLCQAYNIVTTG